jgi:hypothetical protein
VLFYFSTQADNNNNNAPFVAHHPCGKLLFYAKRASQSG